MRAVTETRLRRLANGIVDYGFHIATVIALGLANVWAFEGPSVSDRVQWILRILLLVAAALLVDRWRALGNLQNAIEAIQRSISPPSAADALLLRIPDLDERLDRAMTIDVSGLLLSEFTSRYHRSILKERVQAGASIRFLIVDPTGEGASQTRARSSAEPSDDHFRTEFRVVESRLRKLAALREGALEVRMFPYVPSCGFRILDGSGANADLWVEFYSFRNPTDVSLHLTRADGVWFQFFREEFERMWMAATPLDVSGGSRESMDGEGSNPGRQPKNGAPPRDAS